MFEVSSNGREKIVLLEVRSAFDIQCFCRIFEQC